MVEPPPYEMSAWLRAGLAADAHDSVQVALAPMDSETGLPASVLRVGVDVIVIDLALSDGNDFAEIAARARSLAPNDNVKLIGTSRNVVPFEDLGLFDDITYPLDSGDPTSGLTSDDLLPRIVELLPLVEGETNPAEDDSPESVPLDESGRDVDILGAPALDRMLDLILNGNPSEAQGQEFGSRLEGLLAYATRQIDDGVFDDDPELLRVVERDRDFLAAEAYETADWFALGESIGGITARLERNLLGAADLPREASELLERMVAATAEDDADAVPELLDDIIDAGRLDDPDWLRSQESFDRYASEVWTISEIGARRWLLRVADWWPTEHGHEVRNDGAIGVTIGTPLGAAIGLAAAAVTTASVGTALGVGAAAGGLIGLIVGVTMAWWFGRYAPRNDD